MFGQGDMTDIQTVIEKLATSECPRCGGNGRIADEHEVGRVMRDIRMKARLSLRDLGGQMGFSAVYLSDLERGNRTWRKGLIDDYTRICRYRP